MFFYADCPSVEGSTTNINFWPDKKVVLSASQIKEISGMNNALNFEADLNDRIVVEINGNEQVIGKE